jgi:hypothetical protein
MFLQNYSLTNTKNRISRMLRLNSSRLSDGLRPRRLGFDSRHLHLVSLGGRNNLDPVTSQNLAALPSLGVNRRSLQLGSCYFTKPRCITFTWCRLEVTVTWTLLHHKPSCKYKVLLPVCSDSVNIGDQSFG